MDNLTHSLIGLTAAKAGLERLSPGTTVLCVLAANAPDADIAVLLSGRWEYLQHHRGITHSITGALTLAIALPLAFYFVDWLIGRLKRRAVTVKLKGLLLASVLVTATHPIMDWTNNYGMRFLLPWSSRWSYGDFVFVIDPLIWLLLGGAAFLLTGKTKKQVVTWVVIAVVLSLIVLFGASGSNMMGKGIPLRVLWVVAIIVLVTLHYQEIGKRFGANIGVAALLIVTAYCGTLAAIHSVALRRAEFHAAQIARGNSEQVVKLAAMPTLANPIKWLCNVETDRATYRFNVSLPGGEIDRSNAVRYAKPTGTTAQLVEQATNNRPAEVFLGFARFPVTNVVGEDCVTQTLVQFADLRYTEPGRGRGTFSLDVPVECFESQSR